MGTEMGTRFSPESGTQNVSVGAPRITLFGLKFEANFYDNFALNYDVKLPSSR